MILPAIILFIIACILLWVSQKQRKTTGIPGGKLIYNDTGIREKIEKPLYDPLLRLTGKPDYLIQQKDDIIPVEVKSSHVSDAPYDSHIFQLAAYCLLVNRVYGKRPSYGIINYPTKTFSIDFTQEMEEATINLLSEMRATIPKNNLPRSHESVYKCKSCGYRYDCEQKLGI